ncbi:sister chromatid cohesion protein Dcc1 [Zychaea mexicana]|uniref:sister chromatid cohesion protein Dcc1 n=1 Tax=Zychaea mexicana TaxID=64656 RepID=UPI0022FED903|nr:sister chromatid cohesion protein Dcc1 [Zychaea mexicana]KAI9488097.1 sister chromatid cohesion protein Dcc1 [Zychaea mexicana]
MPELIYSNAFHKGAYSLIELSNEQIAEAIESSGELVIKGLPEDEAVLCTHDQTFGLRQVNTSNSLLLARQEMPNDPDLHVIDDLSHTVEVVPCLARLTRLDELLQPTRYSGQASEQINTKKKLYSYNDLLSMVQASEAELLRGLVERNAFCLNGKYRILERSFMHGLLDALVTNATIVELNLDAMPVETAIDCIRQYHDENGEDDVVPEEVAMACLEAFCDKQLDNTYKMDQEKVCRFMGEVILASARGKEWALDDFTQVWRKLVPDVFSPTMEMLQGLYVVTERAATTAVFHQQRTQTYISYFPLSELSVDPTQRFASLFAEKKQWTPEQILPYIQDLAPDQKARDALLLRFTRTLRSNGQILYGSRIK